MTKDQMQNINNFLLTQLKKHDEYYKGCLKVLDELSSDTRIPEVIRNEYKKKMLDVLLKAVEL